MSTLIIEGYGLDRYSRILGVVYVEGKNLNLELIKEGLAEVYRGKPPSGFNIEPYQKAEAKAKKGRRLWDFSFFQPRS